MDVLDYMLANPYVQCPQLIEVNNVIKNLSVINFYRGAKKAKKSLFELEKKYRKWIQDIVNLDDFEHFYFVSGVTDAINQWIATEKRSWQFLAGDYEYANLISSNGKKVAHFNKTDVVYISNPACATGNFIELNNIDNPLILDCAYIGTTCKKRITLPKNTEQIFFSFSKGWSLVGQRMGVIFTKYPHKSLNLMKKVEAWNYTGVEIAHAIIDNFEIDTIPKIYRELQHIICEKYDLQASDCFFIGTSEDDKFSIRRRTGRTARLDLSFAINTLGEKNVS